MTSLQPGTLADLLHSPHGGRTAVVIPETNRRFTYDDLRARVGAVASALAVAGARRSDRVGIALPNGLPMLVSPLGRGNDHRPGSG